MRKFSFSSKIALPAALVAIVALAGCQSQSASSTASNQSSAAASSVADNADLIKDVKVTPKGQGQVPEVSVPKGLSIDKVAMREAVSGTGDVITNHETLQMRVATYSAANGSLTNQTFSGAKAQAIPLEITDTFAQTSPLPYSKFVGAKVGSYFVLGVPAQPANQQSGSPAREASVEVYYVESAKPYTASDDVVKQLDQENKLPKVTFDDKQVPSLSIPQGVQAPSQLVVKVLKPSTGATVKDTDTVNVYYKGWTWSDGKSFDENYSKGQPFSTPLSGGVIEGWLKGLPGQTVGSTVMLVIPAAMAYGDAKAGSGQPGGPLVFVVNISSASPTPSQ